MIFFTNPPNPVIWNEQQIFFYLDLQGDLKVDLSNLWPRIQLFHKILFSEPVSVYSALSPKLPKFWPKSLCPIGLKLNSNGSSSRDPFRLFNLFQLFTSISFIVFVSAGHWPWFYKIFILKLNHIPVIFYLLILKWTLNAKIPSLVTLDFLRTLKTILFLRDFKQDI